jgi:ABC-type enterochelin transport system permease subunit
MLTVCSLNTLGGKPLVSRSASTHLVLICSILSRMILDFLHCNIQLIFNLFGSTLDMLPLERKYLNGILLLSTIINFE